MATVKKRYTCYKSNGMKIGDIELDSNSDNLRAVYLENISKIKEKHPGTAFIKPRK